jgi:hypothetical protein
VKLAQAIGKERGPVILERCNSSMYGMYETFDTIIELHKNSYWFLSQNYVGCDIQLHHWVPIPIMQ